MTVMRGLCRLVERLGQPRSTGRAWCLHTQIQQGPAPITQRRCVLPDYIPHVRSRIFAALLITLGAALFGYLMARLPAPDVPSAFWIGNLSAPCAVLAFLAGWSQRRPAPAMLAAVLAEVACVVGFYDLPGFLTSYCKGMPLEYCLGAPQRSSPIWLELTL